MMWCGDGDGQRLTSKEIITESNSEIALKKKCSTNQSTLANSEFCRGCVFYGMFCFMWSVQKIVINWSETVPSTV